MRAFVFSADLFPPNIAKHAASASLSDPIAADTERMQRVLEFIIQKRHKEDLILLFDGRSRACRRVMEEHEEKWQPLARTLSQSVDAYTLCPRGKTTPECLAELPVL